MSRIVCLSFLILFCLCTGCMFEDKSNNNGESGEWVAVNSKLPLFSVDSLNGGSVSSANVSTGKVALILFFHSTCKDCKREIPKIEQVWQALQKHDQFALMAISRGEAATAVFQFREEFNLSIPLYLDPEKKAYQLFATHTVPRIYLADKNGIVRFIAIERLDISVAELIQKIESLL